MAFLLPFMVWITALHLHTTEANGVPALFVFGDSAADVGNNNYLTLSPAKANFPPYGIDYPQSKSTGRFSNGYNTVDYLAMKLGFKESPKAYFSVSRVAKIANGVNFASGGSGILDSTFHQNQNYTVPLKTQISYFRRVARYLDTQMEAANLFLSKSLFAIVTGSNDLLGFYEATKLQNMTQGDQFVTLLAAEFKTQLLTLYKLGARNFIVFGLGHLGCAPYVRWRTPSGGCVEELNEISLKLSNAIEFRLRELALTLKGMSYVFVDSYELISDFISDPFQYGFTEINSACCGAGKLNGEYPCSMKVPYCSNRKEYLFWDWSHLSQAAYKQFADVAYSGDQKLVRPMNLQQLVNY